MDKFENARLTAKRKNQLFKTSTYLLKDDDGCFFSCCEFNLRTFLLLINDKKIYLKFSYFEE